MSADVLRKAAAILRERAEKATPAPWDCEHTLGETIEINAGSARTQWRTVNGIRIGSTASSWKSTDRIVEYDADEAFIGPEEIEQREADADYIATMHPGVGLALADWLSRAAEQWDDDRCHSPVGPDEPCGECDRCNRQWMQTDAGCLARLIVGDTP